MLLTPTDSLLFFCLADSIVAIFFRFCHVLRDVVCVCVFLGVVCECLAININTIYFALQKNNKKTNMRLMTVEECSLQAGCLFLLPFFSSA